MKKKILLGFGTLILVVVGAAMVLYGNIDSVVAAAIRGYGPKITGVSVALEDVDISPAKGTASLRGLVVGNPEGFAAPNAFSLGQIHMKLDMKSLGTDVVRIEEILIENPEITYEYGTSGSNIDAIRSHVARMSGDRETGQETNGDKAAESPKIVIGKLLVSGGRIHVSAPMLQGRALTVPLPEIRLSGIGEKSGGASAAEAVGLVMASISSGVSSAAASMDIKDISKGLQEKAGSVAEGLKEGAGEASERLKGFFR